MSISVNWSPDLKALADDLLNKWRDVRKNATDPFAKICIVINDDFTMKWLKQYFLLEHKIPQIMMDLEFVRLPEFVNDWLFAMIHKKTPRERQANQHPYSKNVLTWRIYRVLENAAPEGELKELLNYVNRGNGKHAEKRYALSMKLASLYDDYLDSRFWMLREWEQNIKSSPLNAPEWQIALYKLLYEKDKDTYASEYELSLNSDASKAFEFGFPRYLAVYVFDIPFISAPTLCLLKKMSEAMPMSFWNFNPKDDWLAETPSPKEVKRKLRETIRRNIIKHREALENVQNPVEISPDVNKFYDSSNDERLQADERLLVSMASGARGVIGELCDYSDGNVDVPCRREPLEALKDVQISVHNTYSPRRELEAIKDGLHDFLKVEGNAPHDALVLCADWEAYAPIIDAVFTPMPEAEGYIPITTNNMPGSSPIMQSFEKLMEFRKNRFEVSAVLELLDYPAIRTKFGLDENGVDALRGMVRKANIHWGLDDDDVKSILGPEAANGPYPFTWQRGLDRLTAELMYGFPDNDDLLLTVGGTISGKLHPCGHVEGDRAQSVACLWSIVNALGKLRREFASGRMAKPEEMRMMCLAVIDAFYDDNDNSSLELNAIRKGIRSMSENMLTAGLKENDIEIEVFIKAVLETLNKQSTGRNCFTDAVQFAPLNAYTATPHKFIWICGLNDGKFPKMDRRASFDLIGRHPSLFDATSREKDAFALLKATLCAEERLSLSYVGKEMRTNDDIPSSVLLTNLTDYFKARELKFDTYKHPLQGYSPLYFYDNEKQEELKLPPSYSKRYREMAETLRNEPPASSASTPQAPSPLVAFPLKEDGVTEIALDALVKFFAQPNRFLFDNRLNAKLPWDNELDDEECLDTKLNKALKRRLALENDCRPDAALVVETGNAPDENSADDAIDKAQKSYDRQIKFKNEDDCVTANLAETYKDFLMQPNEQECLELTTHKGNVIRLTGIPTRTITLKTGNGDKKHAFLFLDYIDKESIKKGICDPETLVRHLAVNALLEDGVTTITFSPDAIIGCRPLDDTDDAKAKLSDLLDLATGPVPADYPDFTKTAPQDDKLPEEWQHALPTIEIIL